MPFNALSNVLRQTVGDFRRIDDERALANAAIQRLSTIDNPQAAQWVEMLQKDPRRGLGAAQMYGGIGAIEDSLRVGQAARQANVSDLEQAILQSGGADALQAFRASQQNMAAGRYADAQARAVDANVAMDQRKSDAIWGGGGVGGASVAPRGAGGVIMATALASEDPTKIASAADRIALQQASAMPFERGQEFLMQRNPELVDTYRKSQGYPAGEDVRGLVNERRKSIENLDSIMRSATILEDVDVNESNAGAWEYPINVIINKILQPESAVLLGEAAAITQGMASRAQLFQQEIKRLTEETGSIPWDKIKELQGMALDLAATVAEYELDKTSGWSRQEDALGLRAPERARTQISDSLRDRTSSFLDRRRNTKASKPAPPQPLPSGGPAELQDGVVYQTNMGLGAWDKKLGKFREVTQ